MPKSKAFQLSGLTAEGHQDMGEEVGKVVGMDLLLALAELLPGRGPTSNGAGTMAVLRLRQYRVTTLDSVSAY